MQVSQHGSCTQTKPCYRPSYHCQYAFLLRFGRVLEGCISCQSFADWQEALSAYRPAGKEESKVVIKSAYEVEGMR